VRLETALFRRVQLHRNMKHYRFVLAVCEFIHRQVLPTRDRGDARFRDFVRDEATMGALFEQFVVNFFKKEQSLYRVSAPHVDWDVDANRSTKAGVDLLPAMRTDICLDGPNEKLILDCKFYTDAFQRYHDTRKFISANLYQMFAYLKNQEKVNGWETARGILLYPTVGSSFDEHVHLHGHTIRVVSINLDQNWQKISSDLLALLPNLVPMRVA
jgi:5-methylcytosine-specific restriction enzyme subunit McrC